MMKNNIGMNASTPATLLDDLHALVAEAEKMIGAAQGETREAIAGSIRERLHAAQDCLTGLYTGTRKNLVAGAKRADETIRSNPYQSIAVAAGIGLIVGVLAGRSSK